MPERYRLAAEAARGFMPAAEGLALFETAARYAAVGPVAEIGSYCGKSTIYLAAAASERGQVVLAVDHHRGSEENQPGWEYHDAGLVDPVTGRLDTLPHFRATIAAAGLEDHVIAIVGTSAQVAGLWRPSLGMLFIDGGHTDTAATADYFGWAPAIAPAGAGAGLAAGTRADRAGCLARGKSWRSGCCSTGRRRSRLPGCGLPEAASARRGCAG